MPDEYGPFNSEREAMATQAAAALRAAFDANPGPGAGDPDRLRLLTDACEAAGVVLGDYDLGTLRWLSRWENATVISLAGIIRRTARPPEGTVTEWGVESPGIINVCNSEDEARNLALVSGGTVVSHQVTPWTPAPDTEAGDG